MKKVIILLSVVTLLSCSRNPTPPTDPCSNVKHLEVVYLDGSQQYITQCLQFAVRRHYEFPDTMFVSISDSLKVCSTAIPYIINHYNDEYVTCYQGHRLYRKDLSGVASWEHTEVIQGGNKSIIKFGRTSKYYTIHDYNSGTTRIEKVNGDVVDGDKVEHIYNGNTQIGDGNTQNN